MAVEGKGGGGGGDGARALLAKNRQLAARLEGRLEKIATPDARRLFLDSRNALVAFYVCVALVPTRSIRGPDNRSRESGPYRSRVEFTWARVEVRWTESRSRRDAGDDTREVCSIEEAIFLLSRIRIVGKFYLRA